MELEDPESWKYLNPLRSLFGWVTAISDVTVLLKEIREKSREIKLLYKRLVEKLMSVKEPLEDEKEAIKSSDETVSEKEIMEVLSWHV